MARQNEQYREAFADYARQKEAHDREVTAAQLRFRELQTNEEYFAKVCKRCPRCNAAVEKVRDCYYFLHVVVVDISFFCIMRADQWL